MPECATIAWISFLVGIGAGVVLLASIYAYIDRRM